MKPFDQIKGTSAYRTILYHYGAQRARRSGVPLMNHINEGLVVLDQINASLNAMKAYCLHPIYQADEDLILAARNTVHESLDPYVMLLVMEYRNRANAWLPDKVCSLYNSDDKLVPGTLSLTGLPDPGDLKEVRHMLIADKVQNRKDFLHHHKATHMRTAELNFYFAYRLKALDIDQAEYDGLCVAIDAARSTT